MMLNHRIAAGVHTLFVRGRSILTASVALIYAICMHGPIWGQQTWSPCTNANQSVLCTTASAGNVGIGTASPGVLLTVQGTNTPYSAIVVLKSYDPTYLSTFALARGTIDDSEWAAVHAAGNFSNFAIPGDVVLRANTQNLILSARSATGAIRFGTGANDSEKMTISSNGSVGIGTTTTGQCGNTNTQTCLLTVNGAIGAKEIIVTNGITADYVFKPDYRLTPLTEVASFIQKHHHLPEIPSEAEVKENGISVGDMQVKLLAKVEELTLHLIRAEEKNRELQERIARLESGAR